MSVAFSTVDSFASEPFHGNPAGVLVLPALPSAAWMQAVAGELNLPATAFVAPREGGFDIRWFTVTRVLTLCGHGTLAAARVLWADGHADGAAPILLESPGGTLVARRADDWIELDFPATPPVEVAIPPALREALGFEPLWVGRSRLDLVALLADEASVRSATLDLAALRRVETRGLMITAPSSDGAFDFVSRFFAPTIGIGEDSVTGSAHCCLGPYWAARLGKPEMVAYQASPRGGVVRVRVAGDRVVLGGRATLMTRGTLLVDPA
jgi:PhzF family phenazine biosynthesis protein